MELRSCFSNAFWFSLLPLEADPCAPEVLPGCFVLSAVFMAGAVVPAELLAEDGVAALDAAVVVGAVVLFEVRA